jgi:hypothetical protein
MIAVLTGPAGYTSSHHGNQKTMTTQTKPPRKRARKSLWRVEDMTPQELLIFCPGCKALDVIRFSGQEWIPSRKFRWKSGRFFHDCGSVAPCRLHGAGPRGATAIAARHPLPDRPTGMVRRQRAGLVVPGLTG